MVWCEHCGAEYDVDHYDERGYHRVGADFGPTGGTLIRRRVKDVMLSEGAILKQAAPAVFVLSRGEDSFGSVRLVDDGKAVWLP